MTTKVVTTLVCDRCRDEFVHTHDTVTLGDLSYMILRGMGGSRDSNMALDLCAECTDAFLHFMKNH